MRKTALIMNHNSYPGREYLSSLKGLEIEVITIGRNPEINVMQETRCGGFWRPESETQLKDHYSFNNFPSLKSQKLLEFLDEKKYQIGIQGGTGILKKDLIKRFSLGIINFHPGNLPMYRGSSAPEWQLFENNQVFCTAHLVDEGIDSGKIICKKKLDIGKSSYETFRASIYPETAKFVREIITNLDSDIALLTEAESQDESKAIYRNYIGDDKIEKIKMLFPMLEKNDDLKIQS